MRLKPVFRLTSMRPRLAQHLILWLCLCGLALANTAQASNCVPLPTSAISLKQALERALCLNAQLGQTEALLRRSSASVDEQTASESPQINALVSTAIGLQADEGFINHSLALTPKISAEFKVFDGGARQARILQKKEELHASRLDAVAQKQGIAFEFVSLWVNVLGAHAAAQASKAALASAQNSLAAAQARFNAGAGAMIDVLTAQSNALQAQREASRAEQKMHQQNTQLHTRLNPNRLGSQLEADNNIKLDLDRSDEAVLMLAWNQALSMDWLQTHPTYQAQQLKKQATQAQLTALKSDTSSSISITGSVYPSWNRARQAGQSSSNYKLAADVGLNLIIPLHDGGVNQARYRQLSAQIDADIAQAAHISRQLHETLLNRQAGWQMAQTDVLLTKQALDAAAQAESAHRARYASGLGVLSDLLNAQNELANRQKQFAQAQHELLRASADHAYAAGVISASF